MVSQQLFWKTKSVVEKIPGAFRVYKFVTSRTGEGKIYQISHGPMAGVQWKRYNAHPYWYHTGTYEPHLTSYIADNLRPGDVFWDIGAHAGYHTIAAARAVGPTGKVLAVEPDPNTCAIMKEQLALNQITNVTVLQAAVADREGTTRFYINSLDTRTSTIDDVSQQGKPIDVMTTTLEKLLEQHPAPVMLKMDIEGAEVLALPGGEALFSGDNRPSRFLLGVHGKPAKEFSLQFLRDHGYRFLDLPGFDADVTLLAVTE